MKLKIGLIGAGHLGKIHLKCIRALSDIYELVGFYDVDLATKQEIAQSFKVKSFASAQELIEASEVVDIVTPTVTHFGLVKQALEQGRHVFVEKPVTQNSEHAHTLIQLAKQNRCKVQVGHVERFNPAMLSLEGLALNPMFIEGHRLATFNPRGTDVPVVMDLMIHDLDIVLKMVQSPIQYMQANGVAVISPEPDIANTRIEFKNGCVVNLTASRISLKQMRKLRVFQSDAYISLDFLEKQSQIIRLYDQHPNDLENLMELDLPAGKKYISMFAPEPEPVNAIQMELASLAESVRENKSVQVTLEEATYALEVAEQIMDKIKARKVGSEV